MAGFPTAIGVLTTSAGALLSLFNVSINAGADGEKSRAFDFDLVLSRNGAATTLSANSAS